MTLWGCVKPSYSYYCIVLAGRVPELSLLSGLLGVDLSIAVRASLC